MNKKIAILITALLVVIAGGTIKLAWFSDNTTASTEGNTVTTNDGRGTYCLTDGTLGSMMPMQSHRSYCINAEQTAFAVNAPSEFTFSIIDDQGNILKDFEESHTKLMHVIIVRTDLQEFQHLHPEYNSATGEFKISDLTFSANGTYRIFADFVPKVGMHLSTTSSINVAVGTGAEYDAVPLGSPTTESVTNGYAVTLDTHGALTSGEEQKLSFTVNKDGKLVTDVQEYLGALGHSVILREDTLEFIHAHPEQAADDEQTGTADYMVYFPEAGNYKVFMQFEHNDQVQLVEFVVAVEEGEDTSMMESGEHMMPDGTMMHN